MMNPFMAGRHSEVLEEGDPELLPELIDAAELAAIPQTPLIGLTAYITTPPYIVLTPIPRPPRHTE